MKALHTSNIGVVLFVLGALAVAAPVAAAELDSHMPAETLVYLQWSGRSLTFDGSKFGQMILDPEVKELVEFIRGVIEENIRDEQGRAVFEKAWNCVRIAWQHPMAAGLYDIRKQGVSLAFLIDLGEDKPAFEKEFNALLDLLPADAQEKLSTVQLGEESYTYVTDLEQVEPAFGYLKNLFFITIGPGQAKALLERKPDTSLQANAKYQERMRVVGGEDVQLALYADIETIVAKVETSMNMPLVTSLVSPETAPVTAPAEQVSPTRRITKALGVDKLQAVAAAVRVVDKGMYTKLRLFTPAPHQGLLLPLAGAPLTNADLSGVPGDADLAVAINLSPKAFYDELRRVLKEIDPNLDAMANGVVAAMEQRLEFSLETDLLANLGDTWVYSVSPSQGGPLVGSMITVDAADPEKLQAFIDKLETTLLPPPPAEQQAASQPYRHGPRPRVEKMKVGDTEIHYLRTSGQWAGAAFLPAWAVHENRLYLALWPQIIASAIQNTAEPLTASAEYQALRKRFAPNASAMIYVNTPEIMKKLYPLQLVGGTVLMNVIAARTETNLPVPLWPGSLQSVLQFLIPQMNVISHDAEGITFEGYGTCPSVLPAGPMVVGAGVAAALPAVNRARNNAKQAVSMTRLKGLGTALILYNEAENGYPEDLGLLVEEGYASSKNFISPLSGKQPPRVKDGKFLDPIDYVYIRPGGGVPHETIMMYEDPANYGNRYTIGLFADGHVESKISLPQLQELIRKAKSGETDEGQSDF
ncbi:MAG: hypothetical protein JW849_08465 [Phycisphaerae bacterium]|nr:hypothetical protein [Phycisphaerae bacterium]